jgi:uncharacterized protein (UPF0335 family)
MATTGHNSQKVIADQLRAYLERIEHLNAEKDQANMHIKEVFGEAKAMGYDVPIMRKIIAMRKKHPDAVAEEAAVLDLYKEALGM